jgi:methylenetetrahydrofolate dehydrogenase (NADP+)/methenyltetrahydrofolate cyclohydrolase
MADICRSADILIAAVGRARFIKEDFVGRGAVIIDVGINVDANGNITGDVDPEAVRGADAYTPVPGGVGAVTTSVLAKHVVLAAKRQTERS